MSCQPLSAPAGEPASPLAGQLLDWAGAALAALVQAREELDRINLFEIPDGDTGANLVRTLGYGCSAIANMPSGLPATQMCADFATALWRNASGCSGLILASALKPLLWAFADRGCIDADGLVDGLEAAAGAAAAAVARPVRGTMVTVFEEAARAARAARAADRALPAIAAAVAAAVRSAVQQSQTQIPELARAGVVDAGALGLSLILQALCAVAAKG